MTTHKGNFNTRVDRHTGASFTRKVTSLGVAACVLGSALMAAPAAQAADIGWTPAPTKTVVGSPGEKGPNGHDLISNLGVWPGQKVEYNVGVDLMVTPGADAVTSLSVVDKLPAGFVVDESSIRVVGDNNLNLSPRSDYKITVKDSTLTLGFADEWVAAHVGPDAATPLTKLAVSFSVTVSEDAKPYSSQENVATEIVNGESFASPAATILVPGVDPSETVTGADSKPVGDRVAVGGDKLNYSVKLDGTFGADVPSKEGVDTTATPLELAYDVARFGIVEDFDEGSLEVSKNDVRVLNSEGADVTGLFDVTVKGGVLTVLARATGDRTSVPAEVLNQDYTVEFSAQVRDVATTTNIVGSTVQVVDDREHPVETESSVKVQAVAPTKNAVSLAVAGVEGTPPAEGAPGTEAIAPIPEAVLTSIPENAKFSYKLGSSKIPANRLSPVDAWTVQDQYTSGDRALHNKWSVVADTDILGANGEVLIAKGSVIADQGDKKYFIAKFDGDSVTVTATGAFLEAINDDFASALSWSVYVEATRTAAKGTEVSNTSHEWNNGFDRDATVTTGTEAAVVVEPPVESTDPPVDPTNTPVDPTNPPVDPTDPPVDPTVPPVDPTNPPVDPTVPPGEPSEPAAKGSITIESFVIDEKGEKGAHDTANDAYLIAAVVANEGNKGESANADAKHEPVKVSFEITNTGETALENVLLVTTPEKDSTGSLGDLSCKTGESPTVVKGLSTLASGETASCDGVLTDIKAGTSYAAITTVSAGVVEVTATTASTTAKVTAADEAKVVKATDTDGLYVSLAAAVVVDKKNEAKDVELASAMDNKRGAVTGEGVSTNSPALMGGGVAAILASLAAGAVLFVRRARGALSAKE